MTQRTIGEACQHLEALRTVMSYSSLAPWREEFEAAREGAMDMATRFMDQTFNDARRIGGDALDQLEALRDRYAALTLEGESGRIGAANFNKEFSQLRQRQRDAERRTDEVARMIERLEAVEAEPEVWADDLYRRFPAVCPEFSF